MLLLLRHAVQRAKAENQIEACDPHDFTAREQTCNFRQRNGVARVVVGGALYLTLAGLFAFGIGAILRNTAAGIGAFTAVLFVISPLLSLLPASWDNAISPYLPSNAGQAVMQFGRPSHTLGPWTGLGLFAAYTAGAIAVAAVLLRRRDV